MVIEILLTIIWIVLTIYGLWFLFRAKTYQPLTLDDLALQWKIHKQKTNCNAKILNSMIKRDGQIIGFKCQCGYEYIQKRLITQRVNKHEMEVKHCS